MTYKNIVLIIILGISSTSIAESTHNDTINACSACHGFDGNNSGVSIPNLWRQPEAYLQRQMIAFRDKVRINPTMDAVAHELSDADIEYAAQYYSGKTGALIEPLQWRGDKWPGDMNLGEQIAYTGKLAVKMPACVTCHGPSGVGVAPDFPRLGGQDETYLTNQLHNWKTGQRPPGVMGVMVGISVSLSDEEIKAVAHYFASQGEKK